MAQDRQEWHLLCRCLPDVSSAESTGSVCDTYQCAFKRESGQKRQKYITTRQLPVPEQLASHQCLQCHRWFQSAEGLHPRIAIKHRRGCQVERLSASSSPIGSAAWCTAPMQPLFQVVECLPPARLRAWAPSTDQSYCIQDDYVNTASVVSGELDLKRHKCCTDTSL